MRQASTVAACYLIGLLAMSQAADTGALVAMSQAAGAQEPSKPLFVVSFSGKGAGLLILTVFFTFTTACCLLSRSRPQVKTVASQYHVQDILLEHTEEIRGWLTRGFNLLTIEGAREYGRKKGYHMAGSTKAQVVQAAVDGRMAELAFGAQDSEVFDWSSMLA